MELLKQLIGVLAAGVPLLITTLTFLLKYIGTAKAKKAEEQVKKIGDAVIPYIKEAEAYIHYTGAEKRNYVITKANQYAIENGYNFDEEAVSLKIEELVGLTKKVNTNKREELAQYVIQNT